MRRLVVLSAALVLLGLGFAAAVVASPDSSATVRFGNPDAGSTFPPPEGHDASSHAKDNVIPRTAVISRGGTVTYEIDGDHQPAVYAAGTAPSDIDVPPFPPNFLINDATNRLALGPLNLAPATTTWTSPPFSAPGRYLVICNVTPHFAFFRMYGWVDVK